MAQIENHPSVYICMAQLECHADTVSGKKHVATMVGFQQSHDVPSAAQHKGNCSLKCLAILSLDHCGASIMAQYWIVRNALLDECMSALQMCCRHSAM